MMTWAEKFEAQAVERGLREGRREGMREMLLHQLERRFSPLPDEVSRRLSAIESKDELTQLAERVLSARSLEELGLA
jgi:flagellar biosynthesis/type III secretory pathway protein FliH